MKPYLDAGFLLTLIVNTNGTREASRILLALPPPYQLNLLHQLQVECYLKGYPETKENFELTARQASQNWFRYSEEAIFHLSEVDFKAAFFLAISWIHSRTIKPPLPLLILHPAIALREGFSHFLSFDPRSRLVAERVGLKLLPERL